MMSPTLAYRKNINEIPMNKVANPYPGRVLIVEDEEDLAALLEYNLKKENYQIYLADNGKKALELVEEKSPDVILLDFLLPEMSGWDVCQSIRNHCREDIASIPIIMLTALRDQQDKFRGLELGADAFINKPYAIQEVLLHCRNFAINRKRHLELIRNQDPVLGVQKDDLYKLLIHEIRNQLTIIGGLANLLEKPDNSTKQQKNCLQIIQRSIYYLEDIIKEIKTLELIYQHNNFLAKDKIFLQELINEIVILFSPLAHKKNISLQLISQDIKYNFKQCKTAVKIMLVTILENAVKYSPNNSAIKIQLKKDDTSLQIAVSDNGPGIKLEKQGSIFTKGYRTREAKKNHSGTGLGLYIAKRLADSMGAKITVQSRPGRGSIFTCIFPV